MVRNAELVALAARVYEETNSGDVVARRLGVAKTTAYRLLRDAGVNLPPPGSKQASRGKRIIKGDGIPAVIAAYQGGAPLSRIAADLGVGIWAIRTVLKEAGVPFRPRGGEFRRFQEEELAEAARLYRGGLSQQQIATKLGYGLPVVNRALRFAGVEVRKPGASGANHGNWKGGRRKTAGDYIAVALAPSDPLFVMGGATGYCMEHRLVMARAIGRPLHPHETVHHINGDKADNRLANLQLRFGRHGKGVAMVCSDCGSRSIGYESLDDPCA